MVNASKKFWRFSNFHYKSPDKIVGFLFGFIRIKLLQSDWNKRQSDTRFPRTFLLNGNKVVFFFIYIYKVYRLQESNVAYGLQFLLTLFERIIQNTYTVPNGEPVQYTHNGFAFFITFVGTICVPHAIDNSKRYAFFLKRLIFISTSKRRSQFIYYTDDGRLTRVRWLSKKKIIKVLIAKLYSRCEFNDKIIKIFANESRAYMCEYFFLFFFFWFLNNTVEYKRTLNGGSGEMLGK